MVVNSLPEAYSLIYGFQIFNTMWDIINETMIFTFPFLWVLISEMVRARNSGQDEGNAGVLALKNIESRFVSMIFVILLGCVNFGGSGFTLRIDTISYTQNINECRAYPEQQQLQGTKDAFATVTGNPVVVPPLWGLVHQLSTAFTSTAIQSLPCKDDVAFEMYRLGQTQIQDRQLRDDLQSFFDNCYADARHQYSVDDAAKAANGDIDWLGSDYFINTAGYYDSLKIGPLSGWPSDPSIDDSLNPGKTYRTCKDYWGDKDRGIEERVISLLEEDVVRSFMISMYKIFTDEDTVKAKRKELTKVSLGITALDELNMGMGLGRSDKYGFSDEDDNLVWAATKEYFGTLWHSLAITGRSVVAVTESVKTSSERFMYRESADYVLSILQMVVIMLIPIILLLSGYKLATLGLLIVAYFAMEFINFIWAFAFWLETTWMEALDWTDPNMELMKKIIINTIYMGLPAIWLLALGWAGFTLSPINQAKAMASKPSRDVGNQGAGAAADIGFAVATGGKSLGTKGKALMGSAKKLKS